jgi:hypothetical protein
MDCRKPKLLLLLLIIMLIGAVPAKGRPKRGIRSVDLYNFTYLSESWGDNISLSRGEYKKKDPGSESLYTRSKLVSLKYFDFNNDAKEDAAVAIRTLVNGSMQVAMDYYVFEYRSGRPQQIFHKWQEGPEGLCVNGNNLVITAALWDEADAHCCPSYTEKKIYKWKSKTFVVALRRQWKNYPFQHPGRLERLLRMQEKGRCA